MAEYGKVIGIKEDCVVVSMTRKEACSKCRACIAGLTEKEMLIEAENQCLASTGDWVAVELSPDGFVTALFVIYGLPLIGLMAGILLGYFVIKPLFNLGEMGDLLSFIIGLLFTGLVFLWIRKNEARWKSRKYKPKAVRITEEPSEAEK